MPDKKSPDLTAKYLAHLCHGANSSKHEFARELRHRTTEAEQKLWDLLRNRKLKGKKFRRQHAIADYVVDFYCNESKLAIELDGNYHRTSEAKEYDQARTALLQELGVVVLRFWNHEVIDDPEKVIKKISDYLR
jgi:very-short-patch-repair endonuclease